MRSFLALLAALLVVNSGEMQRVERSTDAMGTTFSVVLYGSDQASMNQAIDAAFDEVHRLDDLLSNYKPASEWEPHQSRGGRTPCRSLARVIPASLRLHRIQPC